MANSGRMLAQWVKNSGFKPIVIDCCYDLDTQLLALACVKVQSLAVEHIKTAVANLSKQTTITYAICGSGLESHQKTLVFLYDNLVILGNNLSVFLAIQNKPNFFSSLNRLRIPYPEVSFKIPNKKDNWLIKPMLGTGGIGIKKYTDLSAPSDGYYWQKHKFGIPISVLFIANKTEYKIIGFQRQFLQHIGEHNFIFSGVINQHKTSRNFVRMINLWLSNLVLEFVLQGLNSLDCIVQDDDCYVLEINPRPSASIQLYSQDLCLNHINNYLSGELNTPTISTKYKAYYIIFATSKVFIKASVQWPRWATDIPKTGSLINAGMPICSIIVGGDGQRQVMKLLQSRQRLIYRLIQ